jgi:hypothetical protein
MEISNGKEAHITVEDPAKQIHLRAAAMICAQSIRTRTRLLEDAASNPTLRVAASSNITIQQPHICDALLFTPAAKSVLAFQQAKITNAIPLGDGFDMGDFSDNFKLHPAPRSALRV